MTSARPIDSWNTGDSYELYVGRWSRLVVCPGMGDPEPSARMTRRHALNRTARYAASRWWAIDRGGFRRGSLLFEALI
jgi:hypothetical protein